MISSLLARLQISSDPLFGAFADDWLASGGKPVESLNPATGEALGRVSTVTSTDYETIVRASQKAFLAWREVPAPQRGELIRQIGLKLREQKDDLGLLVTLETGKILSEGLGEVQEMIDMCDFAVGLSRQLYGLTIATERPRHRLFEQWLPLGPIGVITAFNFPVAVWAWNAMLAAVCGNSVVWKPSHITPLTAIAIQRIASQACRELEMPPIFQLCITADKSGGEWLADDTRIPLVSATGSTAMGRAVAQRVAARLGRSLLELGGNNAIIVTETANQELALRAVGTAGQRCTSLRRLIIHESIADTLLAKLHAAYRSIRIGNPWEDGVLMGPLISPLAVAQMQTALAEAKAAGAEVVYGGGRIDRPGNFVEPALVRTHADLAIVQRETFAPILYVMTYRTLDEALAIQNGVPQGLSSAIFTERLRDAETFLSPRGSDCGIANVNIGTSGAEIGGAFGGEKDSGGGRESGSDAWKAYMRRQTCTINYGDSLPLAQGVKFDL